MGIAKGDRVAIWAPNIWEWIVCALAIHTVGGVMVPVNTRYKGIEAAYLLEKSGAKALFTVTDFLDVDYVALLRGTDAELPELAQIIVLRGEAPEGTLSYREFLERRIEVSRRPRKSARRRSVPTTSPTSSSPRAPLANPRARCARTHRTCACSINGARSSAFGKATDI